MPDDLDGNGRVDVSEYHNVFPNLSVRDQYDPFCQAVIVESVTEEAVKGLADRFDYSLFLKSYIPIIHELTHWLQHTGTLWGMRFLQSIYGAIDSWASNDPVQFARIIEYAKELRMMQPPAYYSYLRPEAQNEWDGKPWRLSIWRGSRFGQEGTLDPNEPIVLNRFATADSVELGRDIFSIEGLLETCAVWAEVELESLATVAKYKNRELKREAVVLEGKILDFLYTPQHARYCMSTHYLANRNGIDEIRTAFEISSKLAWLCLNLPTCLFQELRVPDFMAVDSAVVNKLRKSKDRAFAYVCMGDLGPKESIANSGQWISEMLRNAGLPALAVIQEETQAEMNEIVGHAINDEISARLQNLLKVGRYNFLKLGVLGNGLVRDFLDGKELVLPQVNLAHGTRISISPRVTESLNEWTVWHRELVKWKREIEIFIDACRPF